MALLDNQANRRAEGGDTVGMMETYFAIRIYAFYVMLGVLGICGIILLVILIKESNKRR